VSDKDLVKIALNDVDSSAGFAPERIIGDIPFVILSDRAMQLLIQNTLRSIFNKWGRYFRFQL
jgi:hypothetical protein